MQLSDLDAIVFDAVGTLIVPRPSVAEAYALAAAHAGLQLTAGDLRPRFRQAFVRQEELDQQRPQPWHTDEAHERARWQAIVRDVFPECHDHGQRAKLFAALWEHFARPEHWALTPGAADVLGQALNQWQSSGVRVAIGSNFDERLNSICAGLPPLDRMTVFVSSAIEARKPARTFFERITTALQAAPKRTLMVGDDWTNDMLGAHAAGWKTAWLRQGASDVHGVAAAATFRPDLVLDSLAELLR